MDVCQAINSVAAVYVHINHLMRIIIDIDANWNDVFSIVMQQKIEGETYECKELPTLT
jgi:hypothetical protein